MTNNLKKETGVFCEVFQSQSQNILFYPIPIHPSLASSICFSLSSETLQEKLTQMDKHLHTNLEDTNAIQTKILILENLNRFNDALTNCNILLKINASDIWALRKSADLLLKLNDYEGALEKLNTILTINPDDQYALFKKNKAKTSNTHPNLG